MNCFSISRVDPLVAEDFVQLAQLMPETALTLVRCVGTEAAIALLNTWPGVEIRVPRFPDAHPSGARRWMQIANVIGEIAMQKLASLYGGTMLEIPLCSRARQAKRNRIICRDFDHLTGKPPEGIGLSKTEAVQEIGMRYAPISARQIESILNR